MATQLEKYLAANGSVIAVKGKEFAVSDFCHSDELDLDLATFKSARASYTGMLLSKNRVAGRPGAETWQVTNDRGTNIVRFAVHEGKILTLV